MRVSYSYIAHPFFDKKGIHIIAPSSFYSLLFSYVLFYSFLFSSGTANGTANGILCGKPSLLSGGNLLFPAFGGLVVGGSLVL